MKSRTGFLIFTIILWTIFACSSPKSVTNTAGDGDGPTVEEAVASADRDGLTFEKAVIVNSIKEEYNWIERNYPGAKVERQALIRKNGKPYDVLTFMTTEGVTKETYFDISKFFGKKR